MPLLPCLYSLPSFLSVFHDRFYFSSLGMPFRRLTAQHRMRPEIAELMKHIYNNLQNHESVTNFPNIKGVCSNIFFIDHHEREVCI